MEHWSRVSCNTGTVVDSAAVCHLLNAIGSVDHTTLANAILDLVNRHLALADCTVLAYMAERNPRIVSVASQTDYHQIFHCTTNYARHLYQHDRIQLHLQSILPQQEINCVTVHRQTLAQIVDAELRRLFSETLGVVDSMAISIKTGRREWITVHLCRHREQGAFNKQEIETILQLAPLIATSVSRHYRIEADGEGDFRASVSDGIDELCSLLTQRERQVILRILDGMTIEKIAEELGLKPTTVVTYRSRGYEKLGIKSRRELFSAVLRNRRDPSPWQSEILPDNPPRFTGPTYVTSTGTDRSHQ